MSAGGHLRRVACRLWRQFLIHADHFPHSSADPDTYTNSDPDCLTQLHSFAKPNSVADPHTGCHSDSGSRGWYRQRIRG